MIVVTLLQKLSEKLAARKNGGGGLQADYTGGDCLLLTR